MDFFNLKSISLEDTVVRGARVNNKNSSTTKILKVNPQDYSVVYTGEVGIEKEYVIQSSLIGNNIVGYATFVDKSDVILNYTGSGEIYNGDKIKLETDRRSYTVTGINGNTIYIREKYEKESSDDGDTISGTCFIRKIKLNSVTYEKADSNIIYSNDKWNVTGINFSAPIIATDEITELDNGVYIQFQKSYSNNDPDLGTILSTHKVLVDNNKNPIYDVAIDPIPFTHNSLQVYISKNGSNLYKAEEYKDYLVNYSNENDIKYPIPPYEERDVAYLKFLGYIEDETQAIIDNNFNGSIEIVKKELYDNVEVNKNIQDILVNNSFKITVGDEEKVNNVDYILNPRSGLVRFVKHKNRECIVSNITYAKKLTWDGFSVIKGVRREEVKDFSNLVIEGITGLKGIDYTVYFEDTEENNLIRDRDFILDSESGAFRFVSPLKKDEVYLVSYYVEGEDIEDEKVNLDTLRLKSFPIITGSLILTMKYSYLSTDGKQEYKTKVLIENIDYKVSYVTGHIELLSGSNYEILDLTASYTPLTPINCIVRATENTDVYEITIVNDILSYTGNNTNQITFKIRNPIISVPEKRITTTEQQDNYSFVNSIKVEDIISIRTKDRSFDLTNATYSDLTKEIVLDSRINNNFIFKNEHIYCTYSFRSDILPYAPILVIVTIINRNDDYFVIEGFDKTGEVRPGDIIRIDNRDPRTSYYFLIKDVIYRNNSTIVKLYSTFSETIINPEFYLIDGSIAWKDFSEDIIIDKTVPVGSSEIIIKNRPIFIKSTIKKNSLLLINDYDIYNVVSVNEIDNESTAIEIYPSLHTEIKSIKYNGDIVYNENASEIVPNYFVISDINQPVFTLFYNSPEGYEGNAKILFNGYYIVIEEYIMGIKNPFPYEFDLRDYNSISDLIQAIVSTKSKFNEHVSIIDVPEYYPFTIVNNNKEHYYLPLGSWGTDSIVSLNNEEPINLPYTFTIRPVLTKANLLRLYKDSSVIEVLENDVTDYFRKNMVIGFVDKNSFSYFFNIIKDVSYDGVNTSIILSNRLTKNVIDPYLYLANINWKNLSSTLININYSTSSLRFSGDIPTDLKENTIICIEDKYVYRIKSIDGVHGYYDIFVYPDLDTSIKVQSYYSFVKYSALPVEIDGLFESNRALYFYSNVSPWSEEKINIKIDDNKIYIKTICKGNEKINEIDLSQDKKLYDLIKDISEIISSTKNEKVINIYKNSLIDVNSTINDYIPERLDEYVSLPYKVKFGINSFEIGYNLPIGFSGSIDVYFYGNTIVIKEEVKDYHDETYTKETRIDIEKYSTFLDIILNVIPNITSVISDYIKPFYCTIKNEELLNISVNLIKIANIKGSDNKKSVYLMVEEDYFYNISIPEIELVEEKDFVINNGYIELTNPIKVFERYYLSYLGLDTLKEYENKLIKCTCRYLSSLPSNSRVEVFYDYLNIDQFYIQKLTERKFCDIVIAPQLQEILIQKNATASITVDGSDNSNYKKGLGNTYYYLKDEYIKKNIYYKLYKWYKDRLRNFSAELQLILGFKLGNSCAVVENDGYYSIEDSIVERDINYTLTKDEEIEKAVNRFSKFFPLGYDNSAPDYYHRFGKEYLFYGDVYCCNIRYKNEKNEIVNIGVVKAEQPYWSKESDLLFEILYNANKNLVGFYFVDIPLEERQFSSYQYTFLRTINIGDRIKIDNSDNYYTINEIVKIEGKNYEYIITKSFDEKEVKTYDIVNSEVSLNSLIDSIPTDGYKIWINRRNSDVFSMHDDFGSLGATAYGNRIEGYIENTRRIKKPLLLSLLKLFFPMIEAIEPSMKFKVLVKKDSESDWVELGYIDLSKLTLKEECSVDDVLDALRYDFTERFVVPTVPPYTVYDIKETDQKGLHRYFYISFERIYDAESSSGYRYGIVFRSKNRNWWFKIVDGGDKPVIGTYGFVESNTYKNFYEPDNLYRYLLLEKQAWETSSLIVEDLYDYSNKLSRAFDFGLVNIRNNRFKNYLISIGNILINRIEVYDKLLRFLVDNNGPVYRILYPDLVHAEKDSSFAINRSFNETSYALDLYKVFYDKTYAYFLYLLKEYVNTWTNSYIRWVLSIEKGILPQKLARSISESNSNVLVIGPYEMPAIMIKTISEVIDSAKVSILSNLDGKYLNIRYSIKENNSIVTSTSYIYLYYKKNVNNISNIFYKTIDDVCAEINDVSYKGTKLFKATNVYEHYENNVLPNIVTVIDKEIDNSGTVFNVLNVADHRDFDSRILFLDKNIEDRLYTDDTLKIPAIELSYLGNYYHLKYGKIGLVISTTISTDVRYGVFIDENGEKVLIFNYKKGEENIYEKYVLYNKDKDTVIYKTLYELSEEINQSQSFNSSVNYSNYNVTCDYLFVTSDYDFFSSNTCYLYIATEANYSLLTKDNNRFCYKIYNDVDNRKKLDIIFYELYIDSRRVVLNNNISDVFTIECQKADGLYKTITELCDDINNLRFRGEKIVTAKVIYNKSPYNKLLTSSLLYTSINVINIDWIGVLYADEYQEAIFGKNATRKNLEKIRSAVFSFPMYTANSNPRKQIIENIPVSGKWDSEENKEILEITCLDGSRWTISFSDYTEGSIKNYIAPKEIIDLIDRNEPITEAQYKEIQKVEDKPNEAILKELILKRYGVDDEVTEVRYNLRKYFTIEKLVEAINNTTFNDNNEVDDAGNRKFFNAKLIGSPEIEGKYKSLDIKFNYLPIIKSFVVNMDDGTTEYKSNYLVGWKIEEITLKINEIYKISTFGRTYSYGQSYNFTLDTPERAYYNTYYNYPQAFKTDIRAFEIYSWDTNAVYEIKDNWIYFKSDSVDYVKEADLGQPYKTLGYGIPLASSGKVPENETLIELINRINSNSVVNKYFYANLRFTRDSEQDKGFFEYGYLPNSRNIIPKSNLDNIYLKNDVVLTVIPNDRYIINSFNIVVDNDNATLSLTCDWEYNYVYEKVFYFNDTSNKLLSDIASNINNDLVPQIPTSLVEAEVVTGLENVLTKKLIPTFIEKNLTDIYSNIDIHVGTLKVPALRIKLRSYSGSNFVITSAKYTIPKTRDKLIMRFNINYRGTYSLVNYSLFNKTFAYLNSYISSLEPYPDSIFPYLFNSTVKSEEYKNLEASRLLSCNKSISVNKIELEAKLDDIVAFRVLNMNNIGTLNIGGDYIELITSKEYKQDIIQGDITSVIESIKGDYNKGFISCDVIPIEYNYVKNGRLKEGTYLLSSNTGTYVYFGLLGDIKFVQISDYNLRVFYNLIKERLGKPWNGKEDYFTTERYNENNPCALNMKAFLGYLKYTRYGQIKTSIIDENLIFNKYLWIYMRLHKEFGCDQMISALKKKIERDDQDTAIINQIL